MLELNGGAEGSGGFERDESNPLEADVIIVDAVSYTHLLARDLNRARCIPGKHDDIIGIDQLDKVIDIDQSPIGRTPRSNPCLLYTSYE